VDAVGTQPIAVGTVAPDFQLLDQDGREHTLSQYRGQKVVLAFYPLDFSPVCTKEHEYFTQQMPEFLKRNARVLGISVDSRWAHKAFAERTGIAYPLLSDFNPRGAVARRYGLYIEDQGVTHRATVLVDEHGVVRSVQVHDMPTQRDTADILRILGTLA
jgi:peroxiredoxin